MRRSESLAERPFELLIGALSVFGGAAIPLGMVPPTSLNATLPEGLVLAWAVIQIAGGALIVTGIVLRCARPALLMLGLRLERAGMWPLSAACAVYGLVAIGYAGARALYPAGILLAVAAACVARAYKVAQIEKLIRRHTREDGVGD
jgi:hypothetical protein